MDVATGITLGSLIIAFASALYARYAWSTARMAMAQQAMMSVLLEYRSGEMMDAVLTLWDFRRANPGDIMATQYNEIRERDLKAWRAAAPDARVALVTTTLDFKRRLVSHFYAYMAHLVEGKILPKKICYAAWSKKDLENTPEILVPLETRPGKGRDTGESAVLPSLQRLYDEAPTGAKDHCGSK